VSMTSLWPYASAGGLKTFDMLRGGPEHRGGGVHESGNGGDERSQDAFLWARKLSNYAKNSREGSLPSILTRRSATQSGRGASPTDGAP
jgi:hypothetical protein